MDQSLILVPVFAQVVLTLIVPVMLGAARRVSMRERGQVVEDMALATSGDWNERPRHPDNNYRNQFELPVLFYAAAGMWGLLACQVFKAGF